LAEKEFCEIDPSANFWPKWSFVEIYGIVRHIPRYFAGKENDGLKMIIFKKKCFSLLLQRFFLLTKVKVLLS
jgi:hypothetical protein